MRTRSLAAHLGFLCFLAGSPLLAHAQERADQQRQADAQFDVQSFLDEIRSPDSANRLRALDRLGKSSPPGNRTRFPTPDPARSLPDGQLDRLLDEVPQCLSDRNMEVRERGIAVLTYYGAHDQANRVAVAKLLKHDESKTVRRRAALYCTRLGWPAAALPLLDALDDSDSEVRQQAVSGLYALRGGNVLVEEEYVVAKTLLGFLSGGSSSLRYHSARLLLAAIPNETRLSRQPESKKMLTYWQQRQPELRRCMAQNKPESAVFVAAALLRMDPNDSAAIECLKREIATVKSEYEGNAFSLGEFFSLLGDDAKTLVPSVAKHFKYRGTWGVPIMYGQRHLSLLGPIAVPFIVEELQKAESNNAEEALFMFDAIGYLRVLGQIGAEARGALPEVERLSKSKDRRTRMAAEEALTAIK